MLPTAVPLMLCLYKGFAEGAAIATKESFSHKLSFQQTHQVTTNSSSPESIEKRAYFPSGFHQHGASGAFQNGGLASGNHFAKGGGAYDHGLSNQNVFGNRESSGSKESFSFHKSNSYNQGFGTGAFGGNHNGHGHIAQDGHGFHGHQPHPHIPLLPNGFHFGGFGPGPIPGFGFGGCNLNQHFNHHTGAGGHFNHGAFAYNRGHSTSSASGYRDTFNHRENFGHANQIGHQIGARHHQNGGEFSHGQHNAGMHHVHGSSGAVPNVPVRPLPQTTEVIKNESDLPPEAARTANTTVPLVRENIVRVTLPGPPPLVRPT